MLPATSALKDTNRPSSVKLTSGAAMIAPYAATAVLCALFLTWFLGLNRLNLSYPVTIPRGDCLFESMVVKTILKTGWYTFNSSLGAPQGMELYDFPMAEGAHVLLIRFFGLFSSNWAVVMNLFYLAGYVFSSLTALFAFRQLRLPMLTSIAGSLLFAFLPTHYLRGENHLFLSSYYFIPLIITALLWISTGVPLMVRTSSGRVQYRPTRRGVAALVFCVLIGSGGVYHAFFSALFFLALLIRAALQDGTGRRMVESLLCLATICVSLGLNLLPSFVFWGGHGTNPIVAKRSFWEADAYGLSIADLVLPVLNHRLPALASIRTLYMRSVHGIIPDTSFLAPLGSVISLGFLLLVGISLVGPGRLAQYQYIRSLAGFNLLALLLATFGGFGSLFNFWVSPQIRCYERISVYIAFFALVALITALERISVGLGGSRLGQAFVLISGLLMGLGLLDLTPAEAWKIHTDSTSFRDDDAFVSAIERSMPKAAMILQLPYDPFPEYGFVNKMLDYDHFRGYLHSHDLRWSYGATKGRQEADWQSAIAGLPPARLLNVARLAGYQGIYVNRMGFADRGTAMLDALAGLLDREPMQSRDGLLAFLPITAAATALHPLAPADDQFVVGRTAASELVVTLSGCYGKEGDAKKTWEWCPATAEIRLVNLTGHVEKSVIDMTVVAGSKSTLKMEGLLSDSLSADIAERHYTKEIDVPPGIQTIRLKSSAMRVRAPADLRIIIFGLIDLSIKPL
jgi:phosphoglycerol transferase